MKFPQRIAGVLIPIFALRGKNDMGIGDTAAMTEMVDWCAEQGFSILQILPINETADDNSPYNTLSSMALEPTTLFISEKTIPGLTQQDIDEIITPFSEKLQDQRVQYPVVKKKKQELLERAFNRVQASKPEEWSQEKEAWHAFEEAAKTWLEPYALFRALLDLHKEPSLEAWPAYHRTLAATKTWLAWLDKDERGAIEEKCSYFKFVQWLLDGQWSELKKYARQRNVYLMGDMPYGMSRFSADVWQYPEIFNINLSCGAPAEEAFQGDPFTRVWGQNWGFPPYRWEEIERRDYFWLRQRVRGICKYFDLFRIDHVLGFYRIYTFPWQPGDNHLYVDKSPDQVIEELGRLPRFYPGDDKVLHERAINQIQGERLLKIILEEAGETVVIAEDLGTMADYIQPSLTKLKTSGIRIPQFERSSYDREYLPPENYPELSLATLSTHDQKSMGELWEEAWNKFEHGKTLDIHDSKTAEQRRKAEEASWEIYRMQRLAQLDDRTMMRDYEPVVREGLINRLCRASSWLVIFILSDIFGLQLHFNTPGSSGESNWSERMPYTIEQMRFDPTLEHDRVFIRKTLQATDRLLK